MKASAQDLFGTAEPPPERRHLQAGPLSAVLEDGNLRDIRFNGVEVIRAINYLARDASWGTFKPDLSPVAVEQGDTSFSVRYTGVCGGRFSYRMEITGEASGRLAMEAEGVALADFHTNRTGFVVLHPAEAAGSALTVLHADGTREATRFPARISPDQPAFEIRALTHEPAPGLSCTVTMEGDSFEMEDQRNWTDASFKTYVRPLSKPRPYLMPAGETDRQRVVVSVEGSFAAPVVAHGPARLALGPAVGRMPETVLFLDEDGFGAAVAKPGLMQVLRARLDLAEPQGIETLRRAQSFAWDCGALFAVELVMEARHPEREAAAALSLLAQLDAPPEALLPVARRDFKTRPSANLPDGESSTGALAAALRQAGFAGRVGGGTPSHFTEFNRNPPDGNFDFLFFGVAAIVHAADDISVVETLDVYPELATSARALVAGKLIWLGPCTIGLRHNPYGADVLPNPHGLRVPCARFDPRQASLFGATFAAGVAAQGALSQADTLCLASLAGAFGLFNEDGTRRPLAAVQTELAAAAGAPGFALSGGDLRGIAYRTPSGLRALLANTTPHDQEFALPEAFGHAALIEPDGGLSALGSGGDQQVLPAFRAAILS